MDIIVINGVEFVPKSSVAEHKPSGNEVIVRTYSAGVHIGEISSDLDGTKIVLRNARRLWKWAGAFTLNEVSQQGVNRDASRISKPVPLITLSQAIEVIPIADGVDLSTTEK